MWLKDDCNSLQEGTYWFTFLPIFFYYIVHRDRAAAGRGQKYGKGVTMKKFKWVLSLHLNTSSVAVSSPSVIKCDLDAQIIFYISNQELETLIFWEMLHVMSWQKGRDPKGFASFSVRWPTLNRLLTDGGVCMLVWCFPLIKQLIVLA